MKITRKVINFNKVNQTGGAFKLNEYELDKIQTGGASISSNQQSLEKRVEENEENIKNLVHEVQKLANFMSMLAQRL